MVLLSQGRQQFLLFLPKDFLCTRNIVNYRDCLYQTTMQLVAKGLFRAVVRTHLFSLFSVCVLCSSKKQSRSDPPGQGRLSFLLGVGKAPPGGVLESTDLGCRGKELEPAVHR